MRYVLSENAQEVIREAAATARLVARLFPIEIDDIQYGVSFEGEDLSALHSILNSLAEKLLDLQVEATTISSPKE